jgi:uncharacterized protein with beta-barrel porin domain
MREISGFNGSSEGFLVGFDRDFTSRVFAGGALGYGGNQVNYKRDSGEAKTNSFLATTYFVYGHEDYYVDGALSFTSSSVRNKRKIPGVGVIIPANGLVATSKSSDFEVSPHLGAGMNFYLDKVTKNASLQPFLALDFNYLKEGSYSETGAGPLNLTVKSHSSRQLRTEFGFNMQKTFDFSSGEISPFIKLSYVNKAPVGSTPVVQGFQGQPMTLTTETLALNQHIFSPGVGFYMKMKNNWEMNLRYDGEFSNPSQSHALSLKATWNFPTAKNKKAPQNVALNKPL